jgi:tape measure domain-containing protein
MEQGVKLRLSVEGHAQVSQALRDTSAGLAGVAAAAEQAGAGTRQGMDVAVKGIGSLRAEAVSATSALSTLVQAIGGVAILRGLAGGVLAAADSVWQLRSRLQLATESTTESESVLTCINEVGRNSYKSVADVSEVFLQSATPMRELGFTTQQTLDLTEALSVSLVVSGANAQSSASAIAQFGQAMQLGVLRGQEFNTVVATAPRFAAALAATLGKTRAELKQMADAGQLTVAELAKASNQLDQLRAEADAMPTTIEDARTRARDAFGAWSADVNESTGIVRALVAVIDTLAQHIDTVMRVALIGSIPACAGETNAAACRARIARSRSSRSTGPIEVSASRASSSASRCWSAAARCSTVARRTLSVSVCSMRTVCAL